MTDRSTRPLRADARRNRDSILDAAVAAFANEGLDVGLDRIARQAGVGSATLYRHFPTREALVEAVYRHEVAQLCDAAPVLLEQETPDMALRAWTSLFLDYVTTKYGMIDALHGIAAAGNEPYGHSRTMIQAALTSLVDACASAGTIRTDIDPTDVGAALEGVALICGRDGDRDRAERLLGLIVDGLTVRSH